MKAKNMIKANELAGREGECVCMCVCVLGVTERLDQMEI